MLNIKKVIFAASLFGSGVALGFYLSKFHQTTEGEYKEVMLAELEKHAEATLAELEEYAVERLSEHVAYTFGKTDPEQEQIYDSMIAWYASGEPAGQGHILEENDVAMDYKKMIDDYDDSSLWEEETPYGKPKHKRRKSKKQGSNNVDYANYPSDNLDEDEEPYLYDDEDLDENHGDDHEGPYESDDHSPNAELSMAIIEDRDYYLEDDGYGKEILYYYKEDGVFCTEFDAKLAYASVAELIGEELGIKMAKRLSTVYIRNNQTKTDYVIYALKSSYAEEVASKAETPNEKKRRQEERKNNAT